MGPDLGKHLRNRAVAKYFSPVMSLHRFARTAIIGRGLLLLRFCVIWLIDCNHDRAQVQVNVETQPIAIRDVLLYLVQCLQVPETSNEVIDIGGADILTYREMMQVMAVANGLSKRLFFLCPC